MIILFFFDHCFTNNVSNAAKSLIPAITLAPEHIGHFSPLERALTLVFEWSEKNLPLTPDDITFGSNKKIWWKGTCGHEWETSVKARSNGEKCPICSGARVIAGINDLATLEPLLVKQWSKKNKIKPTEVSIGSHKKVISHGVVKHFTVQYVHVQVVSAFGEILLLLFSLIC